MKSTNTTEISIYLYIRECGVSYTTYNSITAEQIWLKTGGEEA